MKRSPLKRKTPLKAKKGFKNKSGFKKKPTKLKAGKKTNLWAEVRKKLKIEFEARGITSCELRYEGCWRDRSLGFAHSKKRRYLTDEELFEVALLCNPCHDKIEYLPKEEMEAIIKNIIKERKWI